MLILAYIAVVVFALASLVIGTRLLHMWWRTRKLPELLIGLAFLLEAFFTNVLNALEKFSHGWPDLGQASLRFGVVASGCAAAVCLAVGAWRVFRPRDAWARHLTWLCVALMVAYTVDTCFVHHGPRGPRNLAWWWASILGRAGSHAWMGGEAFLYARQMQRRIRLGLADPVIADRMFLWSYAGAATTLLWLGAGVARTLGGAAGLQHPATLQFIAAMGIVATVTNWLVFMAPQAYIQGVRRRAARLVRVA